MCIIIVCVYIHVYVCVNDGIVRTHISRESLSWSGLKLPTASVAPALSPWPDQTDKSRTKKRNHAESKPDMLPKVTITCTGVFMDRVRMYIVHVCLTLSLLVFQSHHCSTRTSVHACQDLYTCTCMYAYNIL